ncbi:hypothetical protein BGZ76_001061 [Entomortierella beljakovae]|nr:hypothetical protein BGZ76_001061 [Entomortierella beljakovae]
MTFAILKLTSTLLAAACAIQAAPVADRGCIGDACNRSIQSGNVNLGSTTNIVPITQVTPITRYQPIVQSFAPIVQSENACDDNFVDNGLSDPTLPRSMQFNSLNRGNSLAYGQSSDLDMLSMFPRRRFNSNADGFTRFGRSTFMDRMNDARFNSDFVRFAPGRINRVNIDNVNNNRLNFDDINIDRFNVNHFSKRDIVGSDDDQLDVDAIKSDCVPSATESCDQSLPIGSTNMGSYVEVKPSQRILPSTVYQGRVQSLDTNIQSAPAQESTLSRSNVNMGSNTFIQPVTKVIPNTTYQPSVSQKATSIEAAGPLDLNLARSSVTLGSSVLIRPTTTVEPLTVFQPTIQSLPFVINDEGCA